LLAQWGAKHLSSATSARLGHDGRCWIASRPFHGTGEKGPEVIRPNYIDGALITPFDLSFRQQTRFFKPHPSGSFRDSKEQAVGRRWRRVEAQQGAARSAVKMRDEHGTFRFGRLERRRCAGWLTGPVYRAPAAAAAVAARRERFKQRLTYTLQIWRHVNKADQVLTSFHLSLSK